MWSCDPTLVGELVKNYQVAGPLFVHALQTIMTAHCGIAGNHLWPQDVTHLVQEDPHYDFVVVGAGSAGSVVANRLSEVPHWKVLLVEAGDDPSLGTEIPQLFYNIMNTPKDWKYKSTAQKGACLGYKTGGCAWPRGKVLGGSSSINAMFYVRGNRRDFDEWAADGNIGWSYEDVLPYFKKSENFNGTLTEDMKEYHGTGGYLSVEESSDISILEEVGLNATQEIGLQKIRDVNGKSQIGVTIASYTTKDGLRHSTARAFLHPVRDRQNLHVIKNAFAKQIIFKPNTNEVEGVLIQKDGKDMVIHVKKELIISAGAINSPHLLLLSGIGPREQLEKFHIPVIADLPVGENLQDHPFVSIYYVLPSDNDSTSLARITESFIESILHRTGPYSSVRPHRTMAIFNTTNLDSELSDAQTINLIVPPKIYNLIDIYRLHDFKDEIVTEFNKLNEKNIIISVYNILLKPKSRGKIMLQSNDPFVYPLIYANYFEDEEDMKTMIRIMRHTMKLKDTAAFKAIGLKLEWLDIDACKNYDKGSDDHLECIARELTFSLYHPTGTVKMGPSDDESAVVDSQLRVRKVQRLRVADASIMPTITRSNTNAPTIMIGEKAADMIKETWINRHSEL